MKCGKKISLQMSLLMIICISMIPVNLLLLHSSNRAVKNVQVRLEESYANEAEIIETRLRLLLNGVEQEIVNAAKDSWTVLSAIDGSGVLEQQNLINHLKNIWQRQELLQGGYLKMDAKEYVSVTYDSSVMTIYQKDEIADVLQQVNLKEHGFHQFTLQMPSGSYYWVWNLNVNGYSWGVFAAVDQVLSILEVSMSDTGDLFLESKEDVILSSVRKEKIPEDESSYFLFSIELEGLDCKLLRVIPRAEADLQIPVGERILTSLALVALIMIPVLWLAVRQLVIRPINTLHIAMKELEQDNIDYRITHYGGTTREFSYLNHAFNEMAEQIKNLRIEKYEAEIDKLQMESEKYQLEAEKQEMEATNLRLQVNPHLLLNSLNMICNLAKLEEYKTIQSYTMNMAEYFRYSLRRTEELVPLRAEMSFVKCYLDMQKVRFPGTFTSVYDIDETLEEMLIPPLLIQNFVENATKYALKMGSEIEIIIIVRKEDQNAVISVIDTGNGMDEETLECLKKGSVIRNRTGKHIGIWNVRRRLLLYYGEDAEMNISSAPSEGTQVWVRLPIKFQGE